MLPSSLGQDQSTPHGRGKEELSHSYQVQHYTRVTWSEGQELAVEIILFMKNRKPKRLQLLENMQKNLI